MSSLRFDSGCVDCLEEPLLVAVEVDASQTEMTSTRAIKVTIGPRIELATVPAGENLTRLIDEHERQFLAESNDVSLTGNMCCILP